jgi:diguanylate cyclase (GGDEF)-like protein/PAS domain S-box-containing protein
MQQKRKTIFLTLVVSVVALNLFIVALVAMALTESRTRKEAEVRTTLENLALLLDQSISSSVRGVDHSLRDISQHLERGLQSHGPLLDADASKLLAFHENWLAQTAELRVVDAQGRVLLAPEGSPQRRAIHVNHDFIAAHRADLGDRTLSSKLLHDRSTDRWVMVLSRRFNHADGRLAGLVTATVPARHFEVLLTGLQLAPHGLALMADMDKTIIARVSPLDMPSGRAGVRAGSPELSAVIASGRQQATYYSPRMADGVSRMGAYRKLAAMPAFVVVGQGEQDYLAQWYADVRKGIILAATFLIVTVCAAWLMWRMIRSNARANRRSQILLQNASDGIHIVDMQGRVIEASDSFCRMLGYPRSEVIGQAVMKWDDGLTEAQIGGLIEQVCDAHEVTIFETVHRRADGSSYPVEIASFALDLSGEPVIFSSARDITERKQIDERQRIAATAFESQVAMVITDAQQRILRVNHAFTEVTGYSIDDVIGKTPRHFSSGRHDAAFYAALWRDLNETGSWQGEIWNRRKGGDVYPQALSIGAVKDGQGKVTHYVATFIDITAHKSSEEQIHKLAFFDPLTQLPNRRLLLERLDHALRSSARHRRKGALLLIDLDDFKSVNDTVGHHEGDRLLELVSRILRDCVRDEDTVARLGSDEFVVLLGSLGEDDMEAARRAEVVATKVLQALNRSFPVGSTEYRCSATVGITLFGDSPGESVSEPMKRVDLALNQAKEAGGNNLCFYDPKMQADIHARTQLDAGLWSALEKGQFFLQYQPQVSADRQIIGVEALVRWLHPERGMVSPAAFIPVAEQNGLIVPLGRWVLETACKQLTEWASNPRTSGLSIAVNVSARQFRHERFVDDVLDILDRTGANPIRLELELTESSLVTDVEGVIRKMDALKARGVRFSLDDFGTGYSSLAYLKRLPLDKLKIDQGFVRDILDDPNDAAIARTVIVLADSLGLTVIAEGVETEAQSAFLQEQGCHAYQGYLFSRPLSVPDLAAFLTTWPA